MPARWAWAATVFSSHCSVEFDGWAMTRAPVDHLAIGLDSSSEMKAPPKPIRPANISSLGRSRPFEVRKRFTPSRLAVMPSTSMMPRLVAINNRVRFMMSFLVRLR